MTRTIDLEDLVFFFLMKASLNHVINPFNSLENGGQAMNQSLRAVTAAKFTAKNLDGF